MHITMNQYNKLHLMHFTNTCINYALLLTKSPYYFIHILPLIFVSFVNARLPNTHIKNIE